MSEPLTPTQATSISMIGAWWQKIVFLKRLSDGRGSGRDTIKIAHAMGLGATFGIGYRFGKSSVAVVRPFSASEEGAVVADAQILRKKFSADLAALRWPGL